MIKIMLTVLKLIILFAAQITELSYLLEKNGLFWRAGHFNLVDV